MEKSLGKIRHSVCHLVHLVDEIPVFAEPNRFSGTSLMKFGQGMCRLATLQETKALTFKDTFSASLKMYHDEIKEYHVQRKKLESRRYEDEHKGAIHFYPLSSIERTMTLQ